MRMIRVELTIDRAIGLALDTDIAEWARKTLTARRETAPVSIHVTESRAKLARLGPDTYEGETSTHDTRMKVAHMIKSLSDKGKRDILNQVIDRYYHNLEQEVTELLMREGDQLDEILTSELMNYFYPGIKTKEG